MKKISDIKIDQRYKTDYFLFNVFFLSKSILNIK